MKFKISLLTILFTFTCFAQDNWQSYKKDNFSIDYPSDWTFSDQKPQPTIQFLLMANEESAKKDQFQENINLNLEVLSEDNTDLDAYLDTTIKQIQSTIKHAKIIENESTKVNDLDAKIIVWSGDFGGSNILQFKQLYFIKEKTAYVLTFTSSETDYGSYIGVGDKILESFKIND